MLIFALSPEKEIGILLNSTSKWFPRYFHFLLRLISENIIGEVNSEVVIYTGTVTNSYPLLQISGSWVIFQECRIYFSNDAAIAGKIVAKTIVALWDEYISCICPQ